MRKAIKRIFLMTCFLFIMPAMASCGTGNDELPDMLDIVADMAIQSGEGVHQLLQEPDLSYPLIMTIEWKAVYEGWNGAAHLYLLVNEETSYHLGYFWPGINLRLNEGMFTINPPEYALSTLSTNWLLKGEWFYIYQRSDTELAVMSRPFILPRWDDTDIEREYREILIISVKEGGEIQIRDEIIMQLPEVEAFCHNEPFAAILNAYAKLELSGFTLFDENLIGHSIFSRIGHVPTGSLRNQNQIMYAFHDINNDGVPELFIGAYWVSGYYAIFGIYAMQNGKPVSVLQIDDTRFCINVQTDIYGGYVIELAQGAWDVAIEIFYELDESGMLVERDILFTGGLDWTAGRDEPDWFRSRDIDGELVAITQDEYIEAIIKFGSAGYMVDVESRRVSLEWKPILSDSDLSAQVTMVEWKVIRLEDGRFRLYVVIDGETAHFAGEYQPAGNFWLGGIPFLDSNVPPSDALTSMGTLWTGAGWFFYIYKANENELAVMASFYDRWGFENDGTFREVLRIPIEAGGEMRVGEYIIMKCDVERVY